MAYSSSRGAIPRRAAAGVIVVHVEQAETTRRGRLPSLRPCRCGRQQPAEGVAGRFSETDRNKRTHQNADHVPQEAVGFDALVAAADGFELEPLAAHLFPSRMAAGDSYVDWKLLALEYFELAEAVLQGRKLEVDGVEGMKDVAVVNAILESSRAGRAVKMSEVESGELYGYQAEIDEALGR